MQTLGNSTYIYDGIKKVKNILYCHENSFDLVGTIKGLQGSQGSLDHILRISDLTKIKQQNIFIYSNISVFT